MDPKRKRSYIYLLIVAAIWGVAGPVIKYTLPDFPPMIFLAYRFFISALLMLPIALALKPKLPKTKREFAALTIAGILGSSVNLGLLFLGFDKTTVLDATVIGNTAPIMVIIGGVILLREKITRRELIGVVIAFLGTMMIIIQPMLEGGLFATDAMYGNFLILTANVAWVFYVIISKTELKHKIDNMMMTTYMFLIGFVTTLPFAIYQSDGIKNLLLMISTAPLKAHLGVWYLAVISGSFAYYLYQEGQKNIEASEATLFGYLSPLFSAPLALLWLRESLSVPFVIGTAVVILGVGIAEVKSRTRKIIQ
ncbi:MAG TPA: DMT family transporter [Patescibacteria group bacterium]|nr:DMT family transporter [Patescibacteria group bacterium]